ncbi:Ig-like domain-containing protein [Umezawaea beigongshangensis]|uniref:Ig-like domain-containing protein n=1 Tax=Umezawaea beigongshangensis TaxID=2780383 RepID=UPI0018F16CFA|nr:Ig-like domain-containing protein [Umezawaea beigongshangensis]
MIGRVRVRGPWREIVVVVVLLSAAAVLLAAGRQASAVDDHVVWSSNQAVDGWYTVDVLANDTAPAGVSVELVSGPTDGVVEPTTSPPGFRWRSGGGITARWTYRITDAAGGHSNTAAVEVGVRLGPEPRDDAHEATDGVLLSVPAPGVLGNDAHPNRASMVAEASSPNGVTARGGRYSLAADGAFEYSPPLGFTGDDSFPYRAVDADGAAAEATVHLTVRARLTPTPTSTSDPLSGGDRPSTGAPEITVHLHGYPATCLEGVIVVGGSELDTWLDESRAGGAPSRPWDFIDLHAIISAELPAGVHQVAFRCGGETSVAGTTALPTTEPLTVFELTRQPESPSATADEPAADVPAEGVLAPDAPPPPPTEGPGAWTLSPSPVLGVPTWREVSTDIGELATSAALTVWFLVLVLLLEAAFPADLVNKIVELVRTPAARRREPVAPRLPGWLRVPGYALAGGVLLAWADPQNKSLADGGTLLKVGAATAALLLVVLAYETPKDLLLRSVRGPARVRAIGLGFAVAASTATASRLLELPVPYVYGLVIVYIALVAEPRGAHRGRATLGGAVSVLVVCLGTWVVAEPVIREARHATAAGPFTLGQAVCVVLVLGVQAVVFGLVPVRPLDGYDLKQWDERVWWLLYVPALFLYVHVVLSTPRSPAVTENFGQSPRATVLHVASALFLVAAVVSLVLRSWFLRRPGEAEGRDPLGDELEIDPNRPAP